jgi:hypothetical protein
MLQMHLDVRIFITEVPYQFAQYPVFLDVPVGGHQDPGIFFPQEPPHKEGPSQKTQGE